MDGRPQIRNPVSGALPFAVVFLLCALLAIAKFAVPQAPSLDRVENGEPALWRIASTNGQRPGEGWLFGTVHVLPPNVGWQSTELDRAVAQADELHIEVLGLEDRVGMAAIFSQLALSPGQTQLPLRVRPSLRDELEELVDAAPMPAAALDRMESWAAALTLASLQSSGLGLSSEIGVERVLSEQFESADKPVFGLETIEEQLGYFDRLPEAQQREMLASVISEAERGKEAFEQLFNAWVTGDLAGLEQITATGFLANPELREGVLVARNRDWAEKIEKMMASPGKRFIALGAAHLVGQDSVINLLEERGFKIERIQ